MSVSSISRSNVLGDDVLLMIFQQLEGEDLVKCEAVCRHWREILLAGTPWRRLFHRQVDCSLLWRKEQKKLESSQNTLPTEQYRDICRNLLQAGVNWRMGRLTKFVHLNNDSVAWRITISDDYVAWGLTFGECAFLDTKSMEITIIPLGSHYHVLEEMDVRWTDHTSSVVEVRDPKNHWIIDVGNAQQNVYFRSQRSFGSGRLVELSYKTNCESNRIIRVWRMGNPPTLIHDRTFEDRFFEIHKVDEQFIVARTRSRMSTILYFISTETLEEFRICVLIDCQWEYNRALLFQTRVNGVVRILDVASGTYFNDVRLPFRKEDGRYVEFMYSTASSNSIVMAIGWTYKKDHIWRVSHLSVYDLEAVKKVNSDPGSRLLYTLQFQFNIRSFVMNESVIALMGDDGKFNRLVTVLKFANFAERKSSDLKEKPEADENVKMKIIYDPFVGSYP